MLDKTIKDLEKVIYPLNAIAQRIAMVVLFILMMITVVDVTGRIFIKPLYGAFELTGFALAIVIFFSLGYTQIKKGHIHVTFLVDRFGKRTQAIVDVITYLIFFLLVALITWQVADYAFRLHVGNDKTADLGIPVFVIAVISSIGILFFAFTMLLELLKAVQKVVKNE
ncbi:TRAP-type C4-dicarboxylate transport system permease small subunit [Virgibacillus natechei]|uniref:TRAP-type C4-dicarboxylate transport system permease small subunit n=1 Tax=Virgibacillus natechei TaxID=1216297 RepID=A0ABS4IL12_9BACI|nr:TRAP transporter small permease [Virgibacillus natechei]MBP1971240.1 TRAP-type C4-dicarboxylate transport system permease small subunit [Virgibacillus natechei]UZD12129.1 TRAP transporter small permease [Virgibacillus natechei]